ncbi:unnamed protein product [Paramecium pentaurelia]|uniref:Uncharacterized protein n=1 Tax=Paramecium pentaurelia TaxID=43138 RepID=A0A8S1TUS2_9CILI|nr:unnamed protein product [Paramecium pentaurelia]
MIQQQCLNKLKDNRMRYNRDANIQLKYGLDIIKLLIVMEKSQRQYLKLNQFQQISQFNFENKEIIINGKRSDGITQLRLFSQRSETSKLCLF